MSSPKSLLSAPIWNPTVRGEVYRLKPRPGAKGHEQTGSRYGVVVQSDSLRLSTWLMAPTSTKARVTSYRPALQLLDVRTVVMVDQISSVDPAGFGEAVARLSYQEMREIDDALRLALGLD